MYNTHSRAFHEHSFSFSSPRSPAGSSYQSISPVHQEPPVTTLIGQPIHFVAGQFTGQTIRAELHELQKADLGRKFVSLLILVAQS